MSEQHNEAAVAEFKDAIERLLAVAQRETDQSRICANFLLAWWNASECGGFDVTEMWKVDSALAEDMVTVFSVLSIWQRYPDSPQLGYGKQFERLSLSWRPKREGYWSGEPR